MANIPRAPVRVPRLSVSAWAAITTQALGVSALLLGQPFVNALIDNPVPRAYRVALLTWTAPNLLTSTLAVPGASGQWPNPLIAGYAVELRTWLLQSSPALQAGVQPTPTVLWQNPQGTVYPVDLRTWLVQPSPSLQAGIQPPPPFFWQNPRRASALNSGWIGTHPATFFSSVMPFTPPLWSNPVRLRDMRTRGFVEASDALLYPPPVAGIFARRPTERSGGARSNWRKYIVSH